MTLILDSSHRRILLLTFIAVLGWQITFSQSYCRPSLGSCCEWISNVTIASINHNTGNEPGYADYTSFSTTLSKGTTYPISIKVSTNSTYVEHVKLYFDWDRDYIFESFVYLGSGKVTGYKVFTGEVTVPSTALDGCSMMRVFMQYAKEPAGACTSNGDGEVEDYMLVVSNSNVPAANFTLPSTACSGQPLTFINTSAISDGSTLNYLWNFADGTNSTLANPVKTFDAPGTYNVSLTTSTFCTTHTVSKSLTINSPPVILNQPQNVAICLESTATFSVSSSNAGATYQWQIDQGEGFSDLASNAVYGNVTSSSLAISSVGSGMHGNRYRCLITKNCTVASTAATLIISSPPIITSGPADVKSCLGDNTTLSITASGQGITYQWQGNFGAGFINLTNDIVYRNVTTRALTVSNVMASLGSYQYRCIVTGLCSSVSSPAGIIINKSTLISSQPSDVTIIGGSPAEFKVTASGEELNYRWQEDAGGGFINITNNDAYKNATTSTLNIVDAGLSKNGYRYRCVVTGTCGDEIITTPAKLSVRNPLPTITSIGATSATEDLPYSYTIAAKDETGNPLIYSVLTKPDWLNFNPSTHTLSGTPSNNDIGGYEIKLNVSNGIRDITQIFTIIVVNTNDAPAITSIAPADAVEGSPYSYVFTARDIDRGDVLSYTALVKPQWLNFNPSTATLAGIPGNGDVGEHNVVLIVSDGTVQVSQHFSLLVKNINDAPFFLSTPLTIVDEDTDYGYVITAEDIDKADKLTFSVPLKPDWLSFDATNNILFGKPTNANVGIYPVKIFMSDGTTTTEQSFNITVKNVNDAPVITSEEVTSVNEDAIYTYNFTAVDEDRDDSLLFAAIIKPSWLTYDEKKGILSGQPSSGGPGSYNVVLSVSDGQVQVDQSFTITVIKTDVIVPPPEISASNPTEIFLSNASFDQSINSDQVIGIFTTADQDSRNHTYQLVSGAGGESNNLFEIENINLYVKNSAGLASLKEFSIRVRSTNFFGNFIDKIFRLEKSEEQSLTKSIEIPTTFSPNDDGINDEWVIKGLKDYSDVCIEVFDRSGVPLYKSTDPSQGWDGGAAGGNKIEGPFFYIVRIKDVVRKGVLIVIK